MDISSLLSNLPVFIILLLVASVIVVAFWGWVWNYSLTKELKEIKEELKKLNNK